MARCLRCGAGNEWLQGAVPAEGNDLLALADALAEAVDGLARCSAFVITGPFKEKQAAYSAWGKLVNNLHAYRAARGPTKSATN